MGRAKRKRTKTKSQPINVSLDHDEASVDLRKWLKNNNCTQPLSLQLRHFADTGRGVTSKKSIKPAEILLKIPLDLLISFHTIRKSELMSYLKKDKPLTIQTLLALFLVMEKQKNAKSEWKCYINSLPYAEPVLPWMCQADQMKKFPENLRFNAQKLQSSFQESFNSAKNSLSPDLDVSVELFRWAYVLVNTRAVYIDPDYLMSKDNSYNDILADEPLLALCPFLDLINHHYMARTKANIVTDSTGQAFYQLTTMTGFKKYREIFISYGAHSNEKLLMEYGFFIDGNVFDTVLVKFQEVLDVLKVRLDERQYKCIKNYEFSDDEVYINHNGVSFVLKAILFVAFNPKIVNYGSFVFSNRYPTEFDDVIAKSTRTLLEFKLALYKSEVIKEGCKDESVKLMNDYLSYRVRYVERLLSLLSENKLCFS